MLIRSSVRSATAFLSVLKPSFWGEYSTAFTYGIFPYSI
jgi:hypothetical protein